MKSKPAKIMIVDDHALVRHGLAQLISDEADMEVCGEAEDVDGALRQLKTANPDLMIIDISLKNCNGIDLIKQVRSRNSKVKILVASMHDETLFAERVLHAGANGYINKQEATEKVIDAIRQVLDGHMFLSAEMNDRLIRGIVDGSSEPGAPAIKRLSDRELEVFELIGQGNSTRDIATRLHLSVKTIETHREHIKNKLNLKNGAELNRHAVQWVLENN